MADIFDFYVRDNRKINFEIAEPIMREDSGVTDFRFHIPKSINNLDMSDWAWWFVFVNANKEKYSIALTLSDDPERPLEYNLATYTVDYAMSIKAGAVQFALEAINTGTGGAIDNEWHTLTYETKVKETLQGNQAEYAETESDIISELLIEVRNKVNQLVGGATPLPVNLKSQMTDPQKVYLYTGTEQGEYTGNWYYHNGTQFVHGGVYGAGVTIDPTLSQSGQAADAKVAGGRIGSIESALGLSLKEPTATANNYGLTYTGLAVYNTSYKIIKYTVTAGQTILIKTSRVASGKATYQWQDAASVPQNNNTHIVGTPVTEEVNGYVTVPEGATYIIFSALKTDTDVGIYDFDRLEQIETNVSNNSMNFNLFVDGINEIVNFPTAEDGRSYGSQYFYYDFFKGQKLTLTNAHAENYAWTCVLRDSDNGEVYRFSVAQGETKTVYVPADGAIRLQIYLNKYPLTGTIIAESVDEYQNRMIDAVAGVAGETTDIVHLNYTVRESIKYAQKLVYGQSVVPFSLLHFSDPHASKTNVTRIVEMANSVSDLIDDVICTGDMVSDKYSDGFAWWGEIDGAEDIMLCIGNHDVTDGSDYNAYAITPSEAYNTYFAPYIANWGVTHTGSLTYYYKDYTAKQIRLIVLDYLLTGADATAQNTWLQSALSGAKTAGYTVVIAQHYPASEFEKIASNFTIIDEKNNPQYSTMYQASVQTFIDGGGKFACYLAGHTHWDMLCVNPNYPRQLFVIVIREIGTKSQDAANIVTIDTTNKTVKIIRIGADKDNYLRGRNILTISYDDHTIIASK